MRYVEDFEKQSLICILQLDWRVSVHRWVLIALRRKLQTTADATNGGGRSDQGLHARSGVGFNSSSVQPLLDVEEHPKVTVPDLRRAKSALALQLAIRPRRAITVLMQPMDRTNADKTHDYSAAPIGPHPICNLCDFSAQLVTQNHEDCGEASEREHNLSHESSK